MSDTKWTPGPWKVHPIKNGLEHEILYGGYYVAMSFGGCAGEDIPGSNAQLIAAAPELYDALEYVAGFASAGGKTYGDHPAVKSALAKARGENQ